MAQVDVLMMVDVEAALASSNLGANIYLVDTNKYLGSGSEGQNELVTKLNTGDTIVWSVASIDPGLNVTIKSFSGQAVSDKYITPVQDPLSAGVWESKFQPPGGSAGNSYQYNATLEFDNAEELTFDPFLVVVN
ncbi:alpha-pore-forming tripartite toxin MakABE regulator [Desulfobacter vibrioformis]|uniref:alpha-pore-forming tripartite toxin MakABE regulator n=1 Tax=Desulfobacter vibrioformis TaxID=34031 RepID=UPI00054E33AE|nr:hypothetical protein [Desulfobacter vibrioformis]